MPRAATEPSVERAGLRAAFDGIPAVEAQVLFGGTAMRVYGFASEALRSVASRVGPTAAALAGTPVAR